MKRAPVFIAALILLAGFSGAVHGIGEKTLSLGGAASWGAAALRDGVTETARVRSNPVLILSSAARGGGAPAPAAAPDLSLSFDENAAGLFRDSTGHYRVIAAPELEAVERRYARMGTGAALFPASVYGRAALSGGPNGPLVIEPQSRDALFAPDSHIQDFSIEFWLYPLNLENGEQILSWISSRPEPALAGTDQRRYAFQRIQCAAAQNRLQWSFTGFFVSPGGADHMGLTITGDSPVVPKSWSHHLVRFDSATGMLEYLVNGRSEAIKYASSSGREGGEVYAPVAGEGGSFVLGGHFMGLMDEFKIHRRWIESPLVRKYPVRGGRVETGAIDLGEGNSGVVKVEALGGRTVIAGTRINSEFRENGRFRFADDSELQFFIRAADNPYRWDESDWRAFIPGTELTGSGPGGPNQGGNIRGRYVQLAVDFYPSSDGESSPYLEELRITYLPDEPPLPPASLVAVAADGGVQLRWKSSPDTDTAGYLIYYGVSPDEYFSEDAAGGPSPIDAGKRNAFFIDGLKNGTLYYFRVAAYDWRDSGASAAFHAGEFSREVRARPLRGLATDNYPEPNGANSAGRSGL
jgi:hypothetical protein